VIPNTLYRDCYLSAVDLSAENDNRELLRPEDKALVEFGNRVRDLRTGRDWTQEKLAEESGIHRTYIGGVERGLRNISLKNISRIAAALDVPIAELFGFRKPR